MAWVSLHIEAHSQNADLLSDTLMEIGALSASIEDANAETSDEQPIFGEPGDPPPGIWNKNIISALFNDDVDVNAVMAEVEAITGFKDLSYTTETVAEQDWVRATQSQFDPIRITDDLWIVPTWHDAPNPEALNIVLDPGLAFGTGSHPTTHLCLAWLVDQVKPHHQVLDYGCGSGILAIAAKNLAHPRSWVWISMRRPSSRASSMPSRIRYPPISIWPPTTQKNRPILLSLIFYLARSAS